MQRTKQTGRAVSMTNGIITGTSTALAFVLLCALITAKLLETEILAQSSTGYAVMIILTAASWMGAAIAESRVKRKRGVVCLLSGLCIYGILLATTALFFGGQYDGAGETALLIGCGSILALILRPNGRNVKNRPRMKIPNR